ncbi:MAG: hypothetical protein WDZ35_16415 [Crocinitomicaceae bacterium]
MNYSLFLFFLILFTPLSYTQTLDIEEGEIFDYSQFLEKKKGGSNRFYPSQSEALDKIGDKYYLYRTGHDLMFRNYSFIYEFNSDLKLLKTYPFLGSKEHDKFKTIFLLGTYSNGEDLVAVYYCHPAGKSKKDIAFYAQKFNTKNKEISDLSLLHKTLSEKSINYDEFQFTVSKNGRLAAIYVMTDVDSEELVHDVIVFDSDFKVKYKRQSKVRLERKDFLYDMLLSDKGELLLFFHQNAGYLNANAFMERSKKLHYVKHDEAGVGEVKTLEFDGYVSQFNLIQQTNNSTSLAFITVNNKKSFINNYSFPELDELEKIELENKIVNPWIKVKATSFAQSARQQKKGFIFDFQIDTIVNFEDKKVYSISKIWRLDGIYPYRYDNRFDFSVADMETSLLATYSFGHKRRNTGDHLIITTKEGTVNNYEKIERDFSEGGAFSGSYAS